MDEDFDDILNELKDEPDPQPEPTWRATIRNGRLVLTGWAPWLACCGPLGSLLPAREREGVTIADLTVHGESGDEISVRFYAVGAELEEVETVLIDWASRTGYRRLWLPDRLVDLEPRPEELSTASVRCTTCRARWQDSSPEFWLAVKHGGAFPRWCPICGCEMPQWTVRPEGPAPGQRKRVMRRGAGWANERRPAERNRRP